MSATEMWAELYRRWYPDDPFQAGHLARNYYLTKYEIVARLQPASICEIGVRAGYSAFAFLHAVPGAHYLGLDNGLCDQESGNAYLKHAREVVLQDFSHVILRYVDTQALSVLPKLWPQGYAPRSFAETIGALSYDLVHVDADHTLEGCLHDLTLAMESGARWVLVDDYDVGIEIREACAVALRRHPEWSSAPIPDGFRGNLLLTRG